MKQMMLAAVLGAALPGMAAATNYPVTVTDIAGRTVEIKAEPERIVVQDGRDIFALALLDRADPMARIVAWNNIVSRSDPRTWELFAKQWPESAARAIDMKFGDEGQVNIEQVVATKPDLAIFQVRVSQAAEEAGTFAQLEAMGVPVLLVDSELDPAVNAVKTVDLLGTVLNREAEAKEFTDLYASRLGAVQAATAGAPQPKVFVEAKAGQKGIDFCCFTHGDVYWGKLVTAAGGQNLGTTLVEGRTGDVALEKVIAEAPDVYLMSGSPFTTEGSVAAPFGFGADKASVQAALKALETRPGFEHVKAVKDGRVFGLYHQLYASALNIYAIEFLAKALYPDTTADIDPQATLDTIIGSMTGLPDDIPVVLGAQAPATDVSQ